MSEGEVFLFIIIAFVSGVVIGGYVFYRLLISAVEKDPHVVINQLFGDEPNVKVFSSDNIEEYIDFLENEYGEQLDLIVETHGNQVYLFEYGTDKFIAQGATIDEAVSRAKELHPGISFDIFAPKEPAHEQS